MNATKLICTLGPACKDQVGALIAAGMDVARINFSHGDHRTARASFESVHQAAEDSSRQIGVLADLPGPKVRLGKLPKGQILLDTGTVVTLNGDADTALSTTYERLGSDLEEGDRILLSDGAAELRVLEAAGSVRAEVVRGGRVRSGGGVNIPAERLSLPAIGDRDRGDAQMALELGADFIAQSFVRSAADVEEMCKLIGGRAALIAKIETKAAIEDFDAILDLVDAVMVARGDLGVELPFEEIPLIQKDLIRRCLDRGVPAIVATQMLESMTMAPRPTRAEASDVANAVLDGADSIMLSAETAIGKFPIEAATAATRIADVADSRAIPARPSPRLRVSDSEQSREDRAVAQAAASLAHNGVVQVIACFTRTGSTARQISAVRPGVPIYAFSSQPEVLRQLAINKCVQPRICALPHDTDAIINVMEGRLRDEDRVAPDSSVLMLGSMGERALRSTSSRFTVSTDIPTIFKEAIVCRSIKTLRNTEEPVTEEEIQAAALQFVRKISGYRKPSRANEEVFNGAVDEIASASARLLDSLSKASAPSR